MILRQKQPRSGEICVSRGRKPAVKWEQSSSRGAGAPAKRRCCASWGGSSGGTVLTQTLKALKQSVARRLIAGREHFWQPRYYDFNVWSSAKRTEKLKYIHRNPVARGLVERPEDWPWSSYRHYVSGEEGVIEIASWWTRRKKKPTQVEAFARRRSRAPKS